MSTKADERAARLKAALRDNLRRRKAQARGRAEDSQRVDDCDRAGESAPPEAPRPSDPES